MFRRLGGRGSGVEFVGQPADLWFMKIDLLFLQVCTKGSIEPIYEFKDVARYTLCSQTELGAPNYYYPKLFSQMSKNTVTNGYDVAEIIVGNEAYDMYSSYTLVDNSKLDSFYVIFSTFVNSIKVERNIKLVSTPTGINYFGEEYWDMVSFLDNINLENNSELNLRRNQLVEFINNQLVLFHKINPKRQNMKGYCGISICALINDKKKNEYKNLEFYRLLKEIPQLKIKE
ncbi:MAG: clostripain-related cysteine peptidase [Bacteroidetes bacterium]|nr:clostripain-related cysteine peptidase [Bacteroidota bacterium]